MKIGRFAAALCLTASLVALPVGASFAQTAAAPIGQNSAANPAVEQAALDALTKMSTYLRTLSSFQVSGDTVREIVEDNGQKLQMLGSTTYKVRRPNGFTIEIAEDRQVRKIFYDGKSLTVFAPRMGYYATIAAPSTIREVLDVAAEKYDVTVPLEDLFVWGTDDDWTKDLTSGYLVGYARVAGQDTDQYAFQQDGVDWQIWIARGDKPLPVRVVITGTDDPAQPQFQSSLVWDVAPQFADDTFNFTPPAGATPIVIKTAAN
jgi:hypothetical protein